MYVGCLILQFVVVCGLWRVQTLIIGGGGVTSLEPALKPPVDSERSSVGCKGWGHNFLSRQDLYIL